MLWTSKTLLLGSTLDAGASQVLGRPPSAAAGENWSSCFPLISPCKAVHLARPAIEEDPAKRAEVPVCVSKPAYEACSTT